MTEEIRVDGRQLKPLTEPGSDELLSDDVKQRIRMIVLNYQEENR